MANKNPSRGISRQLEKQHGLPPRLGAMWSDKKHKWVGGQSKLIHVGTQYAVYWKATKWQGSVPPKWQRLGSYGLRGVADRYAQGYKDARGGITNIVQEPILYHPSRIGKTQKRRGIVGKVLRGY